MRTKREEVAAIIRSEFRGAFPAAASWIGEISDANMEREIDKRIESDERQRRHMDEVYRENIRTNGY